jgi:hypothetical protein
MFIRLAVDIKVVPLQERLDEIGRTRPAVAPKGEGGCLEGG